MPSIHPRRRRARQLARAALAAALTSALVACAAYRPGTFQRTAPAGTAVVEAGCLDVAATVTDDAVAAWPVVDLQFGNRCDRPVPVDLRAIAASGHTRTGAVVNLVPYDPMAELRPLPLEARSRGRELLQYRDRRDLGVVGADVVDLCLELGALGGAAAQVRCFPRLLVDTAGPAVAQAEVTP